MYSTKTALDGKYRRIKIAYNGDTSAKLDYRQGYFAGKSSVSSRRPIKNANWKTR